MVNPEYRRMQADRHNLFPAIGAVNAARKNYSFQMLLGVPSAFGSCPMKIGNRRVEPPPQSRGVIARTYFYMDATYRPRYRMSRSQRKLFQAWDAMYPPDAWECERARRIKAVQGNANEFTERRCREVGL